MDEITKNDLENSVEAWFSTYCSEAPDRESQDSEKPMLNKILELIEQSDLPD